MPLSSFVKVAALVIINYNHTMSKKFPHITRFIPALASAVLKTILIVLFLALIGANLYLRVYKQTNQSNVLGTIKVKTDTNEYEDKLKYWLEVLRKNPGYRDAYIQVAYYLEKLGRFNEANDIKNSAKRIDLMYK